MNADTVNCAAGAAQRPVEKKRSKIPVKCRQRNRFIPMFLAGVAALSVLSLAYLDIDWLKMTSRAGDIGVVFWDLAHLDFTNMDLILSSLVETVSIAVLSLLYSLILGIIFGMLAARNVFRLPCITISTAHVEYETANRHYAHVDCPGPKTKTSYISIFHLIFLRYRQSINP